jgi:hypothetical protein
MVTMNTQHDTRNKLSYSSSEITRQQAIAKTPAKSSANQISSVTVLFVILVFKV